MGRIGGLLRAAFYMTLVVAIGTTAYAVIRLVQEKVRIAEAQDHLAASRGLIRPVRKRLAPQFSDKHGRLLADTPTDPKQLLDPDTLVLAHYNDAEEDVQLVDWNALCDQLAQATGKDVVEQEYTNSADDVLAVKAGKYHIVALHAADAPNIVNVAGFIPVAVLGAEAHVHGNRLAIAVGAKSKIQSLADIRGHMLACTRPDSITGYRAAITVLQQEAGMRPVVDYSVYWSYSQTQSILGVASGEFQVAALSNDKLQTLLKKGKVKESDYRLIYQSQVIPRLTIGHLYNLKPELTAKIISTVAEFKNEEGPADESTGKPMRFFETDYKKDFEFVRKIDESFDPRFGNRPKRTSSPSPVGDELAERPTSLNEPN